jgi:hypothetical protein
MLHGLIGVIGAVRLTRQLFGDRSGASSEPLREDSKLSANLSKPPILPRRDCAVLDGKP